MNCHSYHEEGDHDVDDIQPHQRVLGAREAPTHFVCKESSWEWKISKNLNESWNWTYCSAMSAPSIRFYNLVFHSTQRVIWLLFLLLFAWKGVWSFGPFPLFLGLHRLRFTKHLFLHGLDRLCLLGGEPPGVAILLHFILGQLWRLLQGGRIAMQIEQRGPRHRSHRRPASRGQEKEKACHPIPPLCGGSTSQGEEGR